ncbi:MAG TPA: hypothetical protein VIH18_31960 [Candidatus Binatia bacterium]
MSALDRRLDRLEQHLSPDICMAWFCSTEADAKELIEQLGSERSLLPLVFVTGKPNSDGSKCRHVESKTVDGLWREFDRCSPQPLQFDSDIQPKATDQVTDEQLLSVIAEAGLTLMIRHDGSSRLLSVANWNLEAETRQARARDHRMAR